MNTSFRLKLALFGIFLTICCVNIIDIETRAARAAKQSATEVEFVVPKQIPIKLDVIEISENFMGAEIYYSIKNLSKEEVLRARLRFFSLDSSGRVKNIKDQTLQVNLPAKTIKKDSFDLDVESDTRVLAAVQEVVANSGVWLVNSSALETAAGAVLKGYPNETVPAYYNKNTVITDVDKSQILRSVLDEILNDENQSRDLSIKDRKNIILSTEHIDFPVLSIPGIQVTPLSAEEIRIKVEQQQSVFYLAFYPIRIEGSKVIVEVAYRLAVKEGVRHQPCCSGVFFEYVKEAGQWKGKRSNIYIL